MKRRKTFIGLDKPEQVKVSKPMMEALAKDLIEGHRAKAYNLYYWPAAREVVLQFSEEQI
ncbi:MAG TPA: hypothetical protein VFM18_04515 [Methanosarcina sp.]|nr:hypothetical protein [Methanosarcina sp.]